MGVIGDGRHGEVSSARGDFPPAATIILPTRNEEDNVVAVVRRLDAALGEIRAEVLFVDDSTDDTPRRIRQVAAWSRRPVRLLHRPPGERVGGLGGAVVDGLRRARTEWAVVMDADLQHPPEVVPSLLAAATDAVDVVVASRYCAGGGGAGFSSRSRVRVSGWATGLARRIFVRRLAGCSDPMSGFFAVRRSALDLGALRPDGFKVLLDVLVRTPGLRVAERPFTFGSRLWGKSKTSLHEGLRFVRLLTRLVFVAAGTPRRRAAVRMLGFGAVGATGIAVNTFAFWLLVEGAGLYYLLGAILATQVSTAWNFALTDTLVFPGDKRGSWSGRYVPFALANNAALLLRLPLLTLLVDVLGLGYVASNVGSLLALFVARFVACDRFIYREGRTMASKARVDRSPVEVVIDLTEPQPRPTTSRTGERAQPDRRAHGYLPYGYLAYRYDIHGLVRIGSDVPLREMEYFRAPRLQSGYDLEVRRGHVGPGGLRRRAVVTQTTSPLGVRYEEHLGRFGADLEVHMGNPIEVTIGPLLVKSPHVLYTNVVEPLLRFHLASRGFALLHAACVDVFGRGVLISARTDTGKTGTVLRLLRGTGALFLSDDMTVVAPDGTALCYPKPLTISRHTLHAVDADHLTRSQWWRLGLQSRLHSKQGRAVGTRLGEMNVPIMALNAVTQRLVPPPKYAVDRLVPCLIGGSVRVEEVFLIERGAAALADVPAGDLVDRLVENTDDAYGFPPFGYLAPALVIGEDGYEQLRARERAILQEAVAGVRARALAAEDFGWAEVISKLVTAKEAGWARASAAAPPRRGRVAGHPGS